MNGVSAWVGSRHEGIAPDAPAFPVKMDAPMIIAARISEPSGRKQPHRASREFMAPLEY